MTQNCCTPEQMEQLKKHCESLGPERVNEIQNAGLVLSAKVREKMENGTPPNNVDVIQLAKLSPMR